MTTLTEIGVYLGAGACIFIIISIAFGVAVRLRTFGIAPKCTARPLDVIYNPNPVDPSQDRGSATFGWYRWTLGLSYDTMLDGIPGTGTRNNGLDGRMLRINLDQIVLLRFHAICLRVAVFATCLCLLIILPININGGCSDIRSDFDSGNANNTGCTWLATDFEKTTMANIPVLTSEVCEFSDTGAQGCAEYVARFCVIVLCSWAVTSYTCVLLRREWMSIIAMRRKKYLEQDVWGRRKEELEETLLSTNISQRRGGQEKRRDPWIPHPEIRETLPNIELYSVLIGGLPAQPLQASDDVEAVVSFTRRQSIDWQLDVTRTFFDRCVPNQPGFSSSVAAVTILPSATELAATWKKWNAHAAAMRRLRFIRSVIADRQGIEEDILSDSTSSPGGSPRNDFSKGRRSIYRDSIRNRSYFQQVLGSNIEAEVESNLVDSLNFLPEQTATYSLELAQSAAGCCPNGFNERRVRNASVDDLLKMEQDAIINVQEAKAALHKAQDEARAVDADVSRIEQSIAAAKEQSNIDKNGEPNIDKNGEPNIDKNGEPSIHVQADPKVQAESDSFFDAESHVSVSISDDMVPFVGPTNNSNSRKSEETELGQDEAEGDEEEGGGGEEEEGEEADEGKNEFIALKMADPNLHYTSGVWRAPRLRGIFPRLFNLGKRTVTKSGEFAGTSHHLVVKAVKTNLMRESCYAAVTFTSRQAAVAARHCLLDGRAVNLWTSEESIPVPPLADAAVCSCGRNLCRPVTLSLPRAQKTQRHYATMLILIAIYLFWTIPLAAISALSDPTSWIGLFPNIAEVAENYRVVGFIFSAMPGLVYTIFFSVVPFMFKLLADFGSNARSVAESEYSALKYYWWFMNISAFWGAALGNIILQGFNNQDLENELRETIVSVANTVPTTISSTWIFWMMTRVTMSLPLNYMLNFNTYLFGYLGLNCLSRANRGGGPGGQTPYRIYIDSGVVFLCLVALAPTCPIVAPIALLNFLYISPLLRRNSIFIYRPKFDAGGIRWPFLFEILCSCLLTGQIVLTAVISLRGRQHAIPAAVLAAIQIIPTHFFRRAMRKRFERSFKDAALLQTSLLDGWDTNEETSMEKREEYRKFLVDAHKAAYVPVCIAGGTTHVLTAEPAVVVPCEHDPAVDTSTKTSSILSRRNQEGFTMRRVKQSRRLGDFLKDDSSEDVA